MLETSLLTRIPILQASRFFHIPSKGFVGSSLKEKCTS